MSQFFSKKKTFGLPSVPFTVRSRLSHQGPKEHYFPSSDGKKSIIICPYIDEVAFRVYGPTTNIQSFVQ